MTNKKELLNYEGVCGIYVRILRHLKEVLAWAIFGLVIINVI